MEIIYYYIMIKKIDKGLISYQFMKDNQGQDLQIPSGDLQTTITTLLNSGEYSKGDFIIVRLTDYTISAVLDS